jgi:hypothetical protein
MLGQLESQVLVAATVVANQIGDRITADLSPGVLILIHFYGGVRITLANVFAAGSTD